MFLIPKNHRSPDQYGKQSVQIEADLQTELFRIASEIQLKR